MKLVQFRLKGSAPQQFGGDFNMGDRAWIVTTAFPHPVLVTVIHCEVVDGGLNTALEVYDEDAELFDGLSVAEQHLSWLMTKAEIPSIKKAKARIAQKPDNPPPDDPPPRRRPRLPRWPKGSR